MILQFFFFLRPRYQINVTIEVGAIETTCYSLRISDRVLDVARKMEVAVDIGSGRGFVTRYLQQLCRTTSSMPDI